MNKTIILELSNNTRGCYCARRVRNTNTLTILSLFTGFTELKRFSEIIERFICWVTLELLHLWEQKQKTMKTYNVQLQISGSEFKIIKIKAATEQEACLMARKKIKGMVVACRQA